MGKMFATNLEQIRKRRDTDNSKDKDTDRDKDGAKGKQKGKGPPKKGGAQPQSSKNVKETIKKSDK